LAAVLNDAQSPARVRTDAAARLGAMGAAAARDALTDALARAGSSELAGKILAALGQFEFPLVAETFEHYIAASGTPPELRVTAVEALAHSSAEAVPFLVQLARSNHDPAVRSSAAWAISAHEPAKDVAPVLADLAAREPEVDVRRRLYEALTPQLDVPAERLLPLVQAERDVTARVAGFNALGSAAQRAPSSPLARAFDAQIVPELVQIATGPNSVNVQMRAVFALRRAQTASAQAALAVIAESAGPQIATAARRGLHNSLQTANHGSSEKGSL